MRIRWINKKVSNITSCTNCQMLTGNLRENWSRKTHWSLQHPMPELQQSKQQKNNSEQSVAIISSQHYGNRLTLQQKPVCSVLEKWLQPLSWICRIAFFPRTHQIFCHSRQNPAVSKWVVWIPSNSMPRTVSRNLKARIPVLRFELGFSVKEICKILGIRKTLVYQTLRYHCIYGTTLNPHARANSGPRKLSQINLAFIRDMIAQQHSLYLDEIQEELVARWGILVSIPTLARTLCRLDFSHKKVSAQAIERNKIMRAAFMNKIGTEVLDPAMLMFTDETARDERTSSWRLGWSKVGTRCVQRRCFVRGQCYSILPVLTLDGLITWDIIEGSVTSERFVQFLREHVVRVPIDNIWIQLTVQNCIDTTHKSLPRTLQRACPW